MKTIPFENMRFNITNNISFLIFLILIGISVSAFLLLYIYRKKVASIQAQTKKEQKILFRSVIQIGDSESGRLSKKMHDEVGTILSVIKLNLSKVSRHPDNILQTKTLLEECMALLTSTIEHTRAISSDLMPPTLTKLGYEKGIVELCRQINASNEIKVIVTQSENEVRVSPIIESQVYRAMQEIFKNIIKHSKATVINVKMQSNESGLITKIVHNGIGINSKKVTTLLKTAGALGLKSIHGRLELIDASINYEANETGESTITINVPANEKYN